LAGAGSFTACFTSGLALAWGLGCTLVGLLAAATFTGLAAGLVLAVARAVDALLAGAAFALAALAGGRLASLGFAVVFVLVATSVPSFV
jgi:hypothetical protein